MPIEALIDTGSQVSCINEMFYEEHKNRFNHEILPVSSVNIITAIRRKSKPIKKQIFTDIQLDDVTVNVNLLVIPQLSQTCILGYDFIKNHVEKINIKEGYLLLKSENRKRIFFLEHEGKLKLAPSFAVNVIAADITRDKLSSIQEKIEEVRTNQMHLPSEIIDQLKRLLVSQKEIFSTVPGVIKNYQYRLKVTDKIPYKIKPYPIPFHKRESVSAEIKKMLNDGIIQLSDSPYLNPIVAVSKADGGIRVCLDARRLNSKLTADYEQSESIDDILKYCGGKTIFSTIDLTKSFHQVLLHPDDRQYTAFMHEGRVYEYCRLPFGLKVSLAGLSRGLTKVLGPLNGVIRPYVDDLLVMSESPEDHILLLKELFETLRLNGITINLGKSNFFKHEVEYVGFLLSTKGLHPQKEKIKAISEFPRPKSVKDLQSLMGLANYYQRFNSRYAMHLGKLTHLLKKGKKWVWTDEEEQAFKDLKASFIEEIVLHHPDFSKPFILQTDASGYAIAAQLMQKDDVGRLRVISYASRVLRGAEISYTITEKELLAIVWSVKKFVTYLAGKPFEIQTDHHALTHLQNCKNTTNRLLRWSMFLQQFDFQISYIPGKENSAVDALSRNLQGITYTSPVVTNFSVNMIKAKPMSNDPLLRKLIRDFKTTYKDEDLEKVRRENMLHAKGNPGEEKSLEKTQYVYKDGFILSRENGKSDRIVVPESIIDEFIRTVHESMAHMGMTKMSRMISSDFHIKGLEKKLRGIIKRCHTCQTCKISNKTYHAEAQTIKVDEPLQLVSADFLGPLVKGAGGVRYMFVMVDNFSKVVHIKNLRSATTKGAVRCVTEFCERYGTPTRILTDHGTQFTNKVWRDRMKELGIKETFSTIRHPQANRSERVNRDLGNYFRVLVQENHKCWPKYTSMVNRLINNSFQTITGAAPIELHFGIRKETPWSDILGGVLGRKGKEIPSKELKEMRDKAVERIETSGNRAREKFNNTHKCCKFELGEKVLVKALQIPQDFSKQSPKFMKLYEGPYRIVKCFGVTSYLLAYVSEGEKQGQNVKLRGKFHGSMMIPYHE